ncbi:WD40 repeat domain-containing protein [Candidatus Dependentiae bacterium]|nr:WD40 repeat domain-containing protein [Candidatus Dependentiae bacterium]
MRSIMLLMGWCFLTQFSYAALIQKKEEILEELTIKFANNFSHTYKGEQLKSILDRCKLLADEFQKEKKAEKDLSAIGFQAFSQFLFNLNSNPEMLRILFAQKTSNDLRIQLQIASKLGEEQLETIALETIAQNLTSDQHLESFLKTGELPEKDLSKRKEKIMVNSILRKIVMPKMIEYITINKKSLPYKRISDATYNKNGSQLAIAADSNIYIINPDNGEPLHKPLSGHKDSITMLAYNKEFELASSSLDGRVLLWNTLKGQKYFEFDNHKACVNTVSFVPKSNQLISGDHKGKIFVWSPGKDEAKIVKEHIDPGFNVRVAKCNPDSETIIYGNLEGLKVVQLIDGKPIVLSKIGTDISDIPNLCAAAQIMLMHLPLNNHISFKSKCTNENHADHPHEEFKQMIVVKKDGIMIADKREIIPPLSMEPSRNQIRKVEYHPNGDQFISIPHEGDELVLVDLSQVNMVYKIKLGTGISQALLLAAALKKKLDPKTMPQHFATTAAPLKAVLDLIKQENKTAL